MSGAPQAESVEKKIREAEHFLRELRKLNGLAFGDRERFDFNLSAFLSAARAIDYRLRHEQKNDYLTWRKQWDANNPTHQGLLLFVASDRAKEVHESGSGRSMEMTEKPILGGYSDPSGSLEVSGSFLTGGTKSSVFVPRYTYEIDGTEYPVIEACDLYLKVLTSIAADFSATRQEQPTQ